VCENKSGELRSCTSCIIRQGFKDVVGELTENGATSHSKSVSITPLFPLKRGEGERLSTEAKKGCTRRIWYQVNRLGKKLIHRKTREGVGVKIKGLRKNLKSLAGEGIQSLRAA
jgi:hypothetical protein